MKNTSLISTSVLFAALFSSAFFTFEPSSFASIGAKSDTIATDCQNLKGTLTVVIAGEKSECKTSNSKIDFFIGSDGTVEAISWNGRMTPSMEILLGSFNEEYTTALKSSKSSPLSMRASIQTSAHLEVKRNGNASHHSGSIKFIKSGAQ
jgi:hypothetical protein